MSKKLELTNDTIDIIYEDFKDKVVTKEELIALYGIDITDRVYFKCYCEFKHGEDFDEDGLLTTAQHKKVVRLLELNDGLYLGDVNGKHSDITAELNEITFSVDSDDLQEYISVYGRGTSDFFYDHGLFDNDNEDDNEDDNNEDKK